jgi:hypothetical protein
MRTRNAAGTRRGPCSKEILDPIASIGTAIGALIMFREVPGHIRLTTDREAPLVQNGGVSPPDE